MFFAKRTDLLTIAAVDLPVERWDVDTLALPIFEPYPATQGDQGPPF